jgi:hypothetical protein
MKVQHCISQLTLKFILMKFSLRGPRKSYHWNPNSKLHKLLVDIQTTNAKLSSQDGNSREH